MIDLTGLGYDADAAARVALARGAARAGATTAIAPSSRTSRSRPSTEDHHRRRRRRTRQSAVRAALAAGARRRRADPRTGHRAGQHHLSRKLRRARASASLEGSGVEIEVLDGAAMAKLGMGALLGVAQGSVREPRMLVLRWNGGAQGDAPVAFVGKGVTFDTGGISIKPAAGHGIDEVGHGRRRRGRRRDEGARRAQGQGQCRRHLRAGREHAGRQRPAPGRRRHHHVGPDGRGDQHRRRRPARAGRRDHLRPAQLQADDDHRPGDADRRDPDQPRPRIWRPVLATTTSWPQQLLAAGDAVGRQIVAHAAGRERSTG